MGRTRRDERDRTTVATREQRVGGLLVRGLTMAILVTGVGTGADAQSRSRAEVQFGGVFLQTVPGLVVFGYRDRR